MLDAHSTHFAFFTYPDLWGIATPDHKLIYDNTSNKLILKQGKETDLYTKKGKAYLQRLYDDLSERGE